MYNFVREHEARAREKERTLALLYVRIMPF